MQKTSLVRYLQILWLYQVLLYSLRPTASVQRLPVEMFMLHFKNRFPAFPAGRRIAAMPPYDMDILDYHKPAVFAFICLRSKLLIKLVHHLSKLFWQ